MSDPLAADRYPGFAGVEYAHVRKKIYPAFDWLAFDEPSPRRRLVKPLDQARVALVATAGASLPGQCRFARGSNGDSSFREIPSDVERLELTHVGYDVGRARRDPDVVYPLGLLRRLAAEGAIGELAPASYSFMGYVPEPEPLLSDTGPEVARRLRGQAVDLALLVPS